MDNWEKYSRKDLEELWQADVDAGETRLTYNEWAARFIMEQSRSKAKAPAVDKQNANQASDVDNSNSKGKPVDKDTQSEKAKQNAAPQSGGKGKDVKQNAKDIAPDADSGLTMKQEMFCREYIKDYVGQRAAIAAGYAKGSAHVASTRLLKNDKIQKFLATLQKPKLEKLDADAEWILAQYRKMADASLADFFAVNEDGTLKTIGGLPYFDFENLTREQAKELLQCEVVQLPVFNEGEPEPLKIKLKVRDRKEALDVLAKRAGILKEHVEHSGSVDIDCDDKQLAMRVAFLLRKAEEDSKK